MPPADSPVPRWRILVVEDEMLVAMLLEDMLAELGHEIVGVAPRLDEALQLARDAAFDLAILDVHLGASDAFPVADLLAERNIPFAFATGYGASVLPAAHQNRPTLQKPFQTEELKELLNTVLS